MTASTPSPSDVLEFWFGELDEHGLAAPETKSRWWRKSPDFDAEIRERFGALFADIAAGGHQDWLENARGTLAAVIVLDQFSRNMFRGSGDMYQADDRAQAIVAGAIERNFDEQLPPAMQAFLYMPLMHSEKISDQKRCCELFSTRADTSEGPVEELFSNMHNYAVKHRDIVARFDRFPHRNELVGRPTTDEEATFLEGPGSSF